MTTLKRILAATAAALPLLAGAAQAGDAEGRFAVKGIGLMPCQAFLQAAQNQGPEAALAISWLTGFVSGANMFLDQTYDLVSWQEQILPNALASTCSAMPEEPVATAATQILQGLMAERIQTAQAPEEIAVGELRMLLYPEVTRRMQQVLASRGISVTVDGDFGPGTQSALQNYQTQLGLPPTGFPDPRTMLSLFQAAPAQQAARQPQPQPQPQPRPIEPLDIEPVRPALGGGN